MMDAYVTDYLITIKKIKKELTKFDTYSLSLINTKLYIIFRTVEQLDDIFEYNLTENDKILYDHINNDINIILKMIQKYNNPDTLYNICLDKLLSKQLDNVCKLGLYRINKINPILKINIKLPTFIYNDLINHFNKMILYIIDTQKIFFDNKKLNKLINLDKSIKCIPYTVKRIIYFNGKCPNEYEMVISRFD